VPRFNTRIRISNGLSKNGIDGIFVGLAYVNGYSNAAGVYVISAFGLCFSAYRTQKNLP